MLAMMYIMYMSEERGENNETILIEFTQVIPCLISVARHT